MQVFLWLLSLTLIAIGTDGQLSTFERNERIIRLTKDYKENELDSVFYKIEPIDEEEKQTILDKFNRPPFKPFDLIQAFTKALEDDDLSQLKYIFDHEGINPNSTFENNNSFLHYSCDYNRLDFVKYLITKKGLDPNQRNIAQVTCIHLASMRSIEMLHYLVQKNGNLNVKNLNLEMPIHFAITGLNLDTLKYLADKGADVKASNILGYQPIHYSTFFNCIQCLRFLVEEKGIDINEKTKYSVLEEAVKFRRFNIVKYLVQKGAFLNIVDGERRSILKIAEEIENNQAMVFFLRKEFVKQELKRLTENIEEEEEEED